jgi:hypothetical protein
LFLDIGKVNAKKVGFKEEDFKELEKAFVLFEDFKNAKGCDILLDKFSLGLQMKFASDEKRIKSWNSYLANHFDLLKVSPKNLMVFLQNSDVMDFVLKGKADEGVNKEELIRGE